MEAVPPRTASKKCRICGGKHPTLDYGTSSCHVCQDFFTRKIKKERKLKCLVDGKCVINHKDTETRCDACWLQKCLAKGMKLPGIGNEIEDHDDCVVSESVRPAVISKFSEPLVKKAPPKYEVLDNLKSLFHQSDSKPFTFFGADDQEDLPEIDQHSTRLTKETFSDDEEIDDELPPILFTAPASAKRKSFFFTENDPRLAKGLRYMSLTPEEKAASIEIWKRTRPQLAADFKKIKKQANRKRKLPPR